jgi:FkbM family methyltransferase
MNHHNIFSKFERLRSVGTGTHIFDFLGSATNVSFRKGWSQFAVRSGAVIQPAYPPLNEHYFDWIAVLTAVDRAHGTFRMAELGAGWAPWLVRAALAARQRLNIERTELIAVEADEVHFGWVQEHFATNHVPAERSHLLRGAIAEQQGLIRFPRVDNPDENYGASTRGVANGADYIEVPAFAMQDIFSLFSGPIDLLHIDIQGSEYQVIPPVMDMLKISVKSIMIGTHISTADHNRLAHLFEGHGWNCIMNFPRNETSLTDFGEVKFGDGFLLFSNPNLNLFNNGF